MVADESRLRKHIAFVYLLQLKHKQRHDFIIMNFSMHLVWLSKGVKAKWNLGCSSLTLSVHSKTRQKNSWYYDCWRTTYTVYVTCNKFIKAMHKKKQRKQAKCLAPKCTFSGTLVRVGKFENAVLPGFVWKARNFFFFFLEKMMSQLHDLRSCS